jgi:hypothetical protein
VGILDLFKIKNDSSNTDEQVSSSTTIETIVKNIRINIPKKQYCYIALFGDRPLSGKASAEESIMIFNSESKAKQFINGYNQYYRTSKPLSVLPLRSSEDLWAMLNNPSEDPIYTGPLGILVNFSYSGGEYHAFTSKQIQGMGKDGIKRFLSSYL